MQVTIENMRKGSPLPLQICYYQVQVWSDAESSYNTRYQQTYLKKG